MNTPQTRRRSLCVRLADDDGSVTIWSMLWTFMFLIFGGLAVDATNAWRVSAILQATADASALAGALQLAEDNEDWDTVKTAAIDLSEINMPSANHGSVLTDADVEIGKWDWETESFVASDGSDADAVRVTARRGDASDNKVQTFLLRLAGFNYWDLHAQSVSVIRSTQENNCAAASFITSGSMQLGGGNEVLGDVCFHGETSIANGGGDLLVEGVKMSSANTVNIYSLREGSADEDDIRVIGSKSLVVLPEVQSIYDGLVSELSGHETYSGDLLPDYMFGAGGSADVVHINGDKIFGNNGEYAEANTIYVVSGQVQFVSGMDVRNVAIISGNGIIIGGSGDGVHFEDVYFASTGGITSSGSASWGSAESFCDSGEYNTYLLSTQQLQLGGASSIHGVLGAAPYFSPGGAMTSAGGLYFEASQYTSLGGDMNLSDCGKALASHNGAVTGSTSEGSIRRSTLVN